MLQNITEIEIFNLQDLGGTGPGRSILKWKHVVDR